MVVETMTYSGDGGCSCGVGDGDNRRESIIFENSKVRISWFIFKDK